MKQKEEIEKKQRTGKRIEFFLPKLHKFYHSSEKIFDELKGEPYSIIFLNKLTVKNLSFSNEWSLLLICILKKLKGN